MKVTEDNVVQQIQNKNVKAIPFLIQQYGGFTDCHIKRHILTSSKIIKNVWMMFCYRSASIFRGRHE